MQLIKNEDLSNINGGFNWGKYVPIVGKAYLIVDTALDLYEGMKQGYYEGRYKK